MKPLLALEQHGSVGRASAFLGITQSALTKALQRAEDEIGQTLFRRTPKGVEPTPAGLIMLRYAKIMHSHSVETLNEIDGLGNAPGVLRVGGGASFVDSLLPQAMAKAVARHPSMEIRLTVESVERLMTRLRDAELDLLFISEPPGVLAMKDIRWSPLINDEMNIVARPDHPLAKKKNIQVDDLKHFGWVMGKKNDPQRSYLESVYREKRMVPPKVTIECLSRDVAVRIVQRSDLLTLVPNAQNNPDYKDLLQINCRDLQWIRIAGIATRQGFKLPIGGNILIQQTNEICRSYAVKRS